ncbi:GIY-YIG nuclease family protein [Alkalicoccobacillus gibsonii]|uniref:GIY-YIG nuclease family protein n=1 Tax=Alkalicoccobacillus gibsonii TaxID=79881 RepID=UPI003F7C01AC
MSEMMEFVAVAVACFFIWKGCTHFVSRYKKDKHPVQEWHELGLIRERYDSQSTDAGYIYFVKDSSSDLIKVGKAIDVEKRIRNNFGTIMPGTITLIHTLQSKNYHRTETLFHQYWSEKRVKGEWFELSSDDIRWIKRAVYPRDIVDSIKGY